MVVGEGGGPVIVAVTDTTPDGVDVLTAQMVMAPNVTELGWETPFVMDGGVAVKERVNETVKVTVKEADWLSPMGTLGDREKIMMHSTVSDNQ